MASTNVPRQTTSTQYSLSSLIDAAQHQPRQSVDTNPYRRARQTAQQSTSTTGVQSTAAESMLHYPKPNRANNTAGSNDAPLDFEKRYAARETEARPQKIKVAKDMYDGQMPPEYKPSATVSTVPLPRMPAAAPASNCTGCGNRRIVSETPATQARGPQHECGKCGKRRTAVPSAVVNAAGAPHIRSTSEGVQPQSHTSSSSALPTSTLTGPGCRKCGKCGRGRRPGSLDLPQQQLDSSARSGPTTAPLPTRPFGHNASSPVDFGLTYTTDQRRMQLPRIQPNNVPININIEPPTASTYQNPPSAFSRYSTREEAPLVQTNKRNTSKVFRSTSISSIIRSLSRRNKKQPPVSEPQSPLPSQQLQKDGQQSPDQIINKISSAIRSGESPDNSKLTPGRDPVNRPGSPFSFVDKVNEDDAFEMSDMRKSKLMEARKSWEANDEMFLPAPVQAPKASRSVSDNTLGLGLTIPREERLDISPDQRPGITRFKSLRAGVNRAASGVSRSKSLKRLESVKKVPQLWYRSDMALEGANCESVGFAY